MTEFPRSAILQAEVLVREARLRLDERRDQRDRDESRAHERERLREGQRVEFTPEESGKGPRAGEVRLVEG